MFQGKIKVLLLEDNPGNVLLIQEMFKEEIASRFDIAGGRVSEILQGRYA